MAKLSILVNRNRIQTNVARFVVDVKYIAGVEELSDGTVVLTTQHPVNGQRTRTPILNSYDEVADAVIEESQLVQDAISLQVYGE